MKALSTIIRIALDEAIRMIGIGRAWRREMKRRGL
jgi:hypothetical protein